MFNAPNHVDIERSQRKLGQRLESDARCQFR